MIVDRSSTKREGGYVSSYLTHFVGHGMAPEEQFALLKKILETRWLTHPPHDEQLSLGQRVYPQRLFSHNEMVVPEMICFCDIPEAHLAIHSRKYSHFGIVFDKPYLVREGGKPGFLCRDGVASPQAQAGTEESRGQEDNGLVRGVREGVARTSGPF